jgi:hypothetical protein
MTQEAVCPLFGLKSPSIVSDVVHGWSAFLNVSLLQFPPHQVEIRCQGTVHQGSLVPLEMLACGRIWMLSRWRWQRLGTKMPMLPQRVVAAKAETQSSVLLVAGRLEKHLMARQWWLPLDSLGTELMNHVNCVPCGRVANVDKGFPTDNVCAQIGIGCTRPPNKLVGRSKTRPMRKRWGTLGPSWNKSMVERRCRADILMAPSLCCSSDLPPRFFEFVVCCRTFTQLSFIGAAFHRGDSKLELLSAARAPDSFNAWRCDSPKMQTGRKLRCNQVLCHAWQVDGIER